MKVRIELVILVLFSLLIAPYCIRAQIQTKAIALTVDSLLIDINNTTPGAVVLVVRQGEILFNKGYGLANLEYGIPMSPSTNFDIASVSKQFTGFAISKLLEEGEISLNDEVRKYIPELPIFMNTIKIEHLLYHTSGIRDWTGTLTMAGWNYDDVINFDQILRMAYHQKELNFEPGSEFSYSNTGYNLLVEIVQRISGISFRKWTDEHIFEPLEMLNTFFLDDLTEVVPNKAYSYYLGEDDTFHVNLNNTIALGSSSLNTTTEDLAKWVVNLDTKKVGGNAVVERMFQIGSLEKGELIDYAYGFWIGKYRGKTWIDHTGGWESFRTYLTYFPEEKLSIVVLNNNGERAAKTALQIADMFIPENQKPEEQTVSEIHNVEHTVSVTPAILQEYVGTYKLGPAYYLHITYKEGELFVKENNEKWHLLKPLSNNTFWVNEFEAKITFRKIDKMRNLVFKGKNGQKSVNDETELANRLVDYVGEYSSEELKTSYTVTENHGKISLNHFRRGEIALQFLWEDDFEAPQWLTKSVTFFRNKNGEVIGFNATEGGARNQKFYKKLYK